jgi:hypothetical protein
MRKPDEDPYLKLVGERIVMPRGLRLSRFTQEETLAGRTPDFRVLRLDNLVAYCEVKSPRDDWLDNQLDEAPPFTIVGGGRPDPIFNRIARHVAKAETQFDAVNADRSVLNLLAFVNHDAMSHFADLRETLTGMFHAEGGERFQIMPHISERWIGEAKRRIDLFVWINQKENRIEGYVFNEESGERVVRVCDLLGVERSEIKR